MGSNLNIKDFGTTIKEIKGGLYTMCGLSFSNQLRCFGDNKYAQLGQGLTDRNVPNQESLPFINFGTDVSVSSFSVGSRHVCVLLNNKKIKCYGYNGSAQLGLGIGDQGFGMSSQMGDSLPFVNIVENVTSLFAGFDQTCAITVLSKLHCWGGNFDGRLGIGIPAQNRTIYGNLPTDMGENLPVINLGTGRTAKQVAIGLSFTCTLLDNDRVKCWGSNTNHQLGYPDLSLPNDYALGSDLSEMGDNLPYIDLGLNVLVSSITAGSKQICVITSDSKLKCFGQLLYGLLGLGQYPAYDNEMGNNLPYVSLGAGKSPKSIVAGETHTCAIIEDSSIDKIKCWGSNVHGQLGQGHKFDIGDDQGEMGDDLPFVDLGPSLPPVPTTSQPTIVPTTSKPTTPAETLSPTSVPTTNSPTTRDPSVAPTPLVTGSPTLSPTSKPTFPISDYVPAKADCQMIVEKAACEAEKNGDCGSCLFFSDKVAYGFRLKIEFVMDGTRRFSEFESTVPLRTTFKDALKALLQKHLDGDQNIQINKIGQINQELTSRSGNVNYDVYFIDNISSKTLAKQFLMGRNNLSDYVDELNTELNKKMRTSGKKYITGSVTIVNQNIIDLANGKGFCGCQESLQSGSTPILFSSYFITFTVISILVSILGKDLIH